MQRKVNKITDPIENQTLEEVWETIKQRKEAKLDVTDILANLNITRSYQDIVYEQPKVRVTTASQASPSKAHEKPASTHVHQSPSPQKEQENKDWSFVADNEVLIKELDLGRDLLSKAVVKITPELLREIAQSEGLSEDDKRLVTLMTSFVHFAADPESNLELSWPDTRTTILENSYLVLHELKNFSDNVQNRRINSN